MAVTSTALSPKQAGELVGRSKPAIIKAIREGRLSATKDESGGWQIEPVELLRVWPPANTNTDTDTPQVNDGTHTSLLAEIEGLRALVAALENQRDDLRQRLDKEGEERRALTLMLTNQMQQRRKSLWQRLTGRE